MQIKFHSIFVSILLLFAVGLNAQSGLNFQGVARNSNNIILASQPISLRLSILQGSATGTTEYSEIRKVTTNAQGLFSVVIGDQDALSSVGNFSAINWKNSPKFLKIEMDVTAGNNFILLGTTQFQSVAYAQFANSVEAEKIIGILPVDKGGTGVNSLAALKTALAIDKAGVGLANVDNTSDLAKPISTATQTALDTKVSNASFTSTLAQKASATDLDLKAPIASPTFTGTVGGITKTMVGLSAVDNTSDLAKPISTATQVALDSKVSSSTFSATLNSKVSTETFSSTIATKEDAANKSTATDLGAAATSDILFPTQKAVKTYVDAQINSGGVADGGITTNKLAVAAVTDAKVASGIDKAKVGLGNVDNTADLNKPVSTATLLALADKPTIDIRRIAKVDETNSFTGDQQINGNLSLSNGILNLAGGTQIQSGNATSTIFQNTTDEDLLIKTSFSNDSKVWTFEKGGNFKYPDGTFATGDYYGMGNFGIETTNKSFVIGAFDENTDLTSRWNFNQFGNLILPNNTSIETGTETETIIRNAVNVDFSIITYDGVDHGLKFSKDGFLVFDDGSSIGIMPNTGNFHISADGDIVLNNSFEFTSSGNFVLKGDNNTVATISAGQMVGMPPMLILNFDDMISLGNPMSGNSWNFDVDNGNLMFPGNNTMASSNLNNSDNFGFTNENKGFMIETSNTTEGFTWIFNKDGVLSFPDGTTIAGNYSGSTDFELNISEGAGFKITTNPTQPQTWDFDWEGSLIFPDGTTASSNEFDNNDFGFQTNNKGFTIGTYTDERGPNEFFYWNYSKLGVLTFPDGTITSGNISNTSNFGFDTRNAESGFSIITSGTSSGTSQLWEYNTDGSLTFPDGTITSGNISNTSNFGFDTRATNSGFSIITGTSTGTTQLWTFDNNGVLNLPVGGEIRIGNVPLSSLNFITEEFRIAGDGNLYSSLGADLDNGNNYYDGSSIVIPLTHSPKPDQISVIIDNVRIKKDRYLVVENRIIMNIVNFGDFANSVYNFFIDYHY